MSDGEAFRGRTVRSGRDRVIAGLVSAIVVVFLALAVAKPWTPPAPSPSAPGSAAPTASPSSPAAVAVASASPADSPLIGTAALPSLDPLPVAFETSPPPAASAWSAVRWRRLAPDDPLRLIRSVTRWQGGYLAIGSLPSRPSTPVWTSTDAAHWSPVPADTPTTFWQGLGVLAVAAAGGRLGAIGETVAFCGEPCPPTYVLPVVSWTSTDGRRWTSHLLPPEWFADPPARAPVVAFGPAGWVIATVGPAARLATSVDGATWTRLPTDALPPFFELDALQGTRTGYVAVGRWPDLPAPVAAAFWSPDGRTWSASPSILPMPAGSPATGSLVTGIVAGRDGLVAAGRTAGVPDVAAWWRSDDGRTWQSVDPYPMLGPAACAGEGCGAGLGGVLAGDGQRLVAVRGGRQPGAWISFDGRSWRRLAMTGAVPPAGLVTETVLPGGVLVSDGSVAWFGQAEAG